MNFFVALATEAAKYVFLFRFSLCCCSSRKERSDAAIGAFAFALPSLFLTTRKNTLPCTKRIQKTINNMKK